MLDDVFGLSWLQSQAGGSLVSILVMVWAYGLTFRAIVRSGCTAHPGWLVLAFSRWLSVVGAVLSGGGWWSTSVIVVAAAGNVLIGLTGVPAWRASGARLDRLDRVLLSVAVVSIGVAWVSSAFVLVVASAATGVASVVPTVRKAFRDPSRESLWGWAPFAVANLLTVVVSPWEWGTSLLLTSAGLCCVAVVGASWLGRGLARRAGRSGRGQVPVAVAPQ